MFENLSIYIKQFIDEQELKGNSPKTIFYYEKNLSNLLKYYESNRIDKLDLENIKKYAIYLKNKPKYENHPFRKVEDEPVSSTTYQTYIRAVRVFLSWLYAEGYIEDDITKKFRLPSATKKSIIILNDNDLELIFRTLNTNSEIGSRNSCLIALMVDCGLRLNETLTLDLNNVDLNRGLLKVYGKGNKERIVPLGTKTRKLLIKYITKYRGMKDIDNLLVSIHDKPLTQNAVKQIFIKLRKETMIERLHPHLLRHTFATLYIINGGDIFALQQILGHTSLEMVKRYSHLSAAYIIKQHKYNSPLDKIKI